MKEADPVVDELFSDFKVLKSKTLRKRTKKYILRFVTGCDLFYHCCRIVTNFKGP